MICSQCGNDVGPGSAPCPNCGTQLAGNAGQPAADVGQAVAFDAKRLSRDDRVVGGGAGVGAVRGGAAAGFSPPPRGGWPAMPGLWGEPPFCCSACFSCPGT